MYAQKIAQGLIDAMRYPDTPYGYLHRGRSDVVACSMALEQLGVDGDAALIREIEAVMARCCPRYRLPMCKRPVGMRFVPQGTWTRPHKIFCQ